MKNCCEEYLTQKIIAELEGLRYVDKPNFEKYDYITIEDDGEYIKLIVEPLYRRDDFGQYELASNGCVHGYKKNGISGVYQSVNFI